MITQNLHKIKTQIPSHVELIAVSKKIEIDKILEAYKYGQKHFGENYVQELLLKQNTLPKDIFWHFIGHLQSNKVKYIVPFIHLIHGVDNLNLLIEINKSAKKNNRIINCLLQIYIAKEETKFGFNAQECLNLFTSKELQRLKNVNICGVMGMASQTDNVEQVEQEFKQLKDVFESIKRCIENPTPFNIISMGMSQDFDLAIKQGSNMLRVGSLIFGNRK